MEPERFAAELICRLEGVLREREAEEKLEERLRRVRLVRLLDFYQALLSHLQQRHFQTPAATRQVARTGGRPVAAHTHTHTHHSCKQSHLYLIQLSLF